MKLRIILILSLVILLLSFQGANCAQLSADQHFNKASMLYISGDLNGALEELKAALKIDPEYAGALDLQKAILSEKENLPAPNRFAFYLSLAVFLVSVSAAALAAVIYRGKRAKREVSYCFNCKSKLPPNEEVCPYCGTRAGFRTWHTVTEDQKHWYAKVGWTKNPFTLDIHPELFAGYKNEIKEILEKIRSDSGHILITGPLGVGKTTLLRWMSLSLPGEFFATYIARPPQEFHQLTKFIMESLGGRASKDASYYEIYNVDKLRKKLGKRLVLLLDEAHEFTTRIERPLRTLGDQDGVTLVMAGLPETADKLKNEIQPLYERLILEVALKHLKFEDLKDLIRARIADAGGKAFHPFTTTAIEKIYESSKGIPRIAIKLCDAAVTQAIKQNEDKIDTALIAEAVAPVNPVGSAGPAGPASTVIPVSPVAPAGPAAPTA